MYLYNKISLKRDNYMHILLNSTINSTKTFIRHRAIRNNSYTNPYISSFFTLKIVPTTFGPAFDATAAPIWK